MDASRKKKNLKRPWQADSHSHSDSKKNAETKTTTMTTTSAKRPKHAPTTTTTTMKNGGWKDGKNKDGTKKEMPERLQLLLKCKQLISTAGVASRSEEAARIVKEVVALATGHFLEFSRKHDGARLLQTLLKYSTPEQNDVIVSELKGSYVKLSCSPHGRHIMLRVLASCKGHRKEIYKEFRGKVAELLKNKDAAMVLEEAFMEYTTAQDRHSLLQEFYGPEFAIFHDADENLTLAGIFEKKPEKKTIIMGNMRQAMSNLLNKDVCTLNIVHHVIDEYLQHASEEEIQDVIAEAKERVAEFVHTTKGARVTITLFEHGSVKDRKMMLKALKDFVVPTCKDPHGYLVILRIVELVDDTVMVKKTILAPMLANLSELLRHKFGRRPLLYLLVGRSPRYFVVGNSLFEGRDHIREKTSKKALDTKRSELLDDASAPMLRLVQQQPGDLMRDPFSCEVVAEILHHAKGDRGPAMRAVAECVKEEASETHLMTHIVANRILKRLIHEEKEKEKEEESSGPKFSLILADCLKGNMKRWVNTWGAVVLTALLESPLTSAMVLEELESCRGEITADIPASKLLRSVLDKKIGQAATDNTKPAAAKKAKKKARDEQPDSEEVQVEAESETKAAGPA